MNPLELELDRHRWTGYVAWNAAYLEDTCDGCTVYLSIPVAPEQKVAVIHDPRSEFEGYAITRWFSPRQDADGFTKFATFCANSEARLEMSRAEIEAPGAFERVRQWLDRVHAYLGRQGVAA